MSLLEVLVATCVLLGVVVTVVGLFAPVARLSRNTDQSSAALEVARQEMSRLMDANQQISSATQGNPQSQNLPNLDQGVLSWYAKPHVPALSKASLAQDVVVTVTWIERSRQRSLVLNGLVTP